MEKVIKVLFYLLAFIFGINSLYVFFFASDDDYFRVFGLIETNRLAAGFIYLMFSFVLIVVLKLEKNKIKK